MELVTIVAMGLVIFLLVTALHEKSVVAAKLDTEVRMLRERYEPDNLPKEE